jgi:hypothetical protein
MRPARFHQEHRSVDETIVWLEEGTIRERKTEPNSEPGNPIDNNIVECA